MDGVALRDIQNNTNFAAEVCDRLPTDAVVMFHASGRFIHDRLINMLEAAADSRNIYDFTKLERENLKHVSPNDGFFRLRKLVEKKNNLLDLLYEAANEVFSNASRYGVDAFAVPVIEPKLAIAARNRPPVGFIGVGMEAVAHSSVAVLHTESSNQFWIMTQNHVTAEAATEMKHRYSGINQLHHHSEQIEIMIPRGKRAAAKYRQPLLQKRGPIGSVLHPLGHLEKTYKHGPGGAGLPWLSAHMAAPLEFAVTDIDMKRFKGSPWSETRRALTKAAELLAIRPESLRSLTLAAGFSLEA